jgi:hypothetical protein
MAREDIARKRLSPDLPPDGLRDDARHGAAGFQRRGAFRRVPRMLTGILPPGQSSAVSPGRAFSVSPAFLRRTSLQ